MALSQQRKNEIAHKMVRSALLEQKWQLDPASMNRRLGQGACELGLTPFEFKEFVGEIFQEALDEVFGK